MKKINLIVFLLILILVACNKKGTNLKGTSVEEVSMEPAKTTQEANINQIESITSPAYGVVIWEDQKLVYMPNLNIPVTWNVVAMEPGSMYVGGDFVYNDYSKMYIVSYAFDDLRLMDMKTGAVKIIGKMQLTGNGGWTGLAGLSNGTLYASSTNITASYLYTVNLLTGRTTLVGEIKNAPCIIDIAITETRQMYGLDICSDVLVSINPTTAEGKVIGPIGFDANNSQDMDYDETSKKLYLAAYNKITRRGELRLADINTGASTLIGVFPNGDEVECFAFTEKIILDEGFLPIILKEPQK